MCRWLAYIGQPITPEKYLYDEQFSLIEQSHGARKSKSVVNGDGFGLGWYGDKLQPGLFKDILPAWSDENLRSLACQIKASLFMAHVRAATDTPSNRTNCHPFTRGPSLFMHNGQIGGYLLIRRRLENLIPDTLYQYRMGTTDSEALFLILESLLQTAPFHDAIQTLIESVEKIMKDEKIAEPFRFTAAYSDGKKIFAVRYSSDSKAPTLFCDRTENGWLLASEPLDNQPDHWQSIPKNHTVELSYDCTNPTLKAISFGAEQSQNQ